MDPYRVEDYSHPGVFGVKVYNTWIYGISSFYRLGDISLKIANNSAIVRKITLKISQENFCHLCI